MTRTLILSIGLTLLFPGGAVVKSEAKTCERLAVVSPENLPSGAVGQTYSFQLQATGVPPFTYAVTGGRLPPGLQVSPSGLVSGAPQATGDYSTRVEASDSCPAGAQRERFIFSLQVNAAQTCAPLRILSPDALPSAAVGQPYLYQIQASGQAPLAVKVVGSGSPPPGLSVSAAGVISGSPSAAGNYSFRVRVAASCPTTRQEEEKNVTLTVSQFTLSASPVPSSVRASVNAASAANLSYLFTAAPAADVTLQSDRGRFFALDSIIGENLAPLGARVRGGSGSVTETLIIPSSVLRKAEALGVSRLFYRRTFSGGSVTVPVQVEVNLTTGTMADFKISGVQLHFENNRPDITVKRNEPLKAYAIIAHSGSGVLQGRWEVDGRAHAIVNRQLSQQATVTFEIPAGQLLPTIVPGDHRVRFVVISPTLDRPPPEIVYYVVAEKYAGERTLELQSPSKYSVVNIHQPAVFRWSRPEGAAAYRIEFFREAGGVALLSAFVRAAEYRPPVGMIEGSFSPGRIYYWKVQGFDDEGRVLTESQLSSFRTRE